jgi:Rab3 GTPase-activating protein catalytic subunit
MLNCCIERKKAREKQLEDSLAAGEKALRDYAKAKEQAARVVRPLSDAAASDEEEDEFFECDEEKQETECKEKQEEKKKGEDAEGEERRRSEDAAFSDAHTHQADGRLHVLDDLRLLYLDEPLYVPVTQEPAPMTEDMLEEHAEVLAKYAFGFLFL